MDSHFFTTALFVCQWFEGKKSALMTRARTKKESYGLTGRYSCCLPALINPSSFLKEFCSKKAKLGKLHTFSSSSTSSLNGLLTSSEKEPSEPPKKLIFKKVNPSPYKESAFATECLHTPPFSRTTRPHQHSIISMISSQKEAQPQQDWTIKREVERQLPIDRMIL